MVLVLIGKNSANIVETVVKNTYDSMIVHKYASIDNFISETSMRSIKIDEIILLQDGVDASDPTLARKITILFDYVIANYTTSKFISVCNSQGLFLKLNEVLTSPYMLNLKVKKTASRLLLDLISLPLANLREKYSCDLTKNVSDEEMQDDEIKDDYVYEDSTEKGKKDEPFIGDDSVYAKRGKNKKDAKEKKPKRSLLDLLKKKSKEKELGTATIVEDINNNSTTPAQNTEDSDVYKFLEDSLQGDLVDNKNDIDLIGRKDIDLITEFDAFDGLGNEKPFDVFIESENNFGIVENDPEVVLDINDLVKSVEKEVVEKEIVEKIVDKSVVTNIGTKTRYEKPDSNFVDNTSKNINLNITLNGDTTGLGNNALVGAPKSIAVELGQKENLVSEDIFDTLNFAFGVDDKDELKIESTNYLIEDKDYQLEENDVNVEVSSKNPTIEKGNEFNLLQEIEKKDLSVLDSSVKVENESKKHVVENTDKTSVQNNKKILKDNRLYKNNNSDLVIPEEDKSNKIRIAEDLENSSNHIKDVTQALKNRVSDFSTEVLDKHVVEKGNVRIGSVTGNDLEEVGQIDNMFSDMSKIVEAYDDKNVKIKTIQVESIVEKTVEKPVYIGADSSRKGPKILIVTGDRRSKVTKVALNLAKVYMDRGTCLYVDFDLQRRGSLVYLGLDDIMKQPENIINGFSLLNTVKILKEVTYESTWGFSCLISLYDKVFTDEYVFKLQNILVQQKSFDTVIIDCPIENLHYLEDALIFAETFICSDSDVSAVINILNKLDKLNDYSPKIGGLLEKHGYYIASKNIKTLKDSLTYVAEIFDLENNDVNWSDLPILCDVANIVGITSKF